MGSVALLLGQEAATISELNTKFAADGTGKNELDYGDLAVFEQGISGSIGPPLMHVGSSALQAVVSATCGRAQTAPTILGQMELEHCASPDSKVPFPSQRDKEIVLPVSQWNFVTKAPSAGYHLGTTCALTHSSPIYGVMYTCEGQQATFSEPAYKKLSKLTAEDLLSAAGLTPKALAAFTPKYAVGTDPDDDKTFGIPGRCRPGLSHYWALVEAKNQSLRELGNAPVVIEELVAAILYTVAHSRSNQPLPRPGTHV